MSSPWRGGPPSDVRGRFVGPGIRPLPMDEPGPPSPPQRSAGNTLIARSIHSPSVEKLRASRDFYVRDYAIALAAVAGTRVTSASLQFQLPKDQVGWLQVASLYILTPNATTSVVYRIRINGGPIPGFNDWQMPPGVANFTEIGINRMQVELPMGCLVDMEIENLAATGPWTVGGTLAGWYHPQDAEHRVWGLGEAL